MQLTKYYLAAFLAFVIWGFFSLALKPIHEYASLDILFYRIFCSFILLTNINFFFRKKIVVANWVNFKKKQTAERKTIFYLTFIGGLILAANWLLFIYVVNHVSVKAGSLAYMICPILTTIFAYFILNEKLSKWQWLAVFISAFSCFLLSLNNFHDLLFSLVVAATYAMYLVSQRKNSSMDKFLILNVQLFIITLISIPFFPIYSSTVPTESLFYICLFFIVVFFTIIPLFLNLYALKGLNSSTVGILMYINPIINFSLAFFYFKEEVTTLQLFSYFLIFISILIFNEKIILGKRKKSIQLENLNS